MLENACENCNTTGKVKGECGYSTPPRDVDCPVCEGHGYVLTEAGEKLLNFLKRRLVINTNMKVDFK